MNHLVCGPPLSANCRHCLLFNASLTAHCPNRPVRWGTDEHTRIVEGTLEFFEGEWITDPLEVYAVKAAALRNNE